MSNNTSLNPAIRPLTNVTTRRITAGNRVMAFWHTMIGKKVVMAVTGVVLILFVIAHMLGNLKIFSSPDEINTYSHFLREVGTPELAYGQLLWVVRIVLLICVALHITAAVQLSRMSWAARPIGYNTKRNIKTTFAARMMRWGGVLLVAFIIFHLLHLTAGAVGFRPGQFRDLAVYQTS
jgi:succinate dehydrogenase / fumarate reductase cytochrome b subunit